jgi:hypothetical protein
MSNITVRRCITVQVHIADSMVVSSIERTTYIPPVERIESYVKRSTCVCTPVAINVLWACYTASCILVVCNHVSNGITCALETTIRTKAPVTLLFGNLISSGDEMVALP